MASRLFLFLDTNVLIHGQVIDQVDWSKLFSADEVTLVLSITVFHELDRLKDGAQGRLARDRARDFQARFKAYERDVLTELGATVRQGLFLRVLPNEPSARAGLDPSVQDDRIVGAVLDFVAKARGERVALVTRDTGMLLKSRARGIEAVRLPDALERPAELDETERELAKTKKELDRLRSRLPKIQVSLLKDGRPLEKGFLEVQLIRPRPPTAEDIDKALGKERDGRWFRTERPQRLFSTEPFDLHLGAFRSFLKDLASHEDEQGRRIRIELHLQNSGSALASIVELDLSADAPLTFASAVSVPVPERPVFAGGSRGVRPARKARVLGPDASENGPKVQPTKVSYRLPHLLHNDGVTLPPFDAVLPQAWNMDGFGLHAIVRVTELTEAQPFEFHVRTSIESVDPFIALRASPAEDPWL